jgi:TolB-like protein/DNA-binding CsgD family transcriptional regulator
VLDDNPLVETVSQLSERERMVATNFARGMSYRQISESLFIAPTTVRTHLSAIYRKLGIHNKVALVNLIAALHSASGRPPDTDVPGARDRPVLLVLPFEHLSADDRWTRLAHGLSADLIVDLARYSDLCVIDGLAAVSAMQPPSDGQPLRADYVLDGSVQATTHQVRIGVRLVESRQGIALWAARYDLAMENLFARQDDVVDSVINAIAGVDGKVARHRRERSRRRPPVELSAYDCYLLGAAESAKFNRDAIRRAIGLLSRAVELDAGFARAWAILGDAHAMEACNGYTNDPSTSIELWKSCLHRALALDPSDSYIRLCAGELCALRGDIDGAAEEQACALAAAPNDADTLAMLAGSRTLLTGDPDRAYELAKRAISLNPRNSCKYVMLGRCSFVVGRHRECLSALELGPTGSPITLLFRAMAHAMLGEVDAARKIAGSLSRDFRGFSVEGFIRTFPVTNPPALAAIREGASAAGLA